MPGTINSKSGLVKMKCNDFESFDPLNDSCLLGGREVKIKIKVPSPLSMRLRGRSFRVSNQTMRLPLFVAVYLICEGLAEVTI